MAFPTYSSLRKQLDAGQITCLSLVEKHLLAIQEKNDALNVFLEVYSDEALARAKEIDAKIQAGSAGPLAGMVIGLKDVLAYEGHRLQAGSRILDGYISPFSATVVQRLIEADAILIGRQNCDEFAMGSSNENSAFGPTRNAADPTRVPGGSSGASAVAVQAGMCQVSIGSDTGGSVRQPAAFCGVIGLKPTYGRVSRWGLVSYGSSFDCIGPIAHHLEDIAKVMEVIAGPDELDSTVSDKSVPAYSQYLDTPKTYRLAYFKEAMDSPGLAPEVKETMQRSIDQWREEGHTIEPVDFPLLSYLLPTYYILTTAEASSNLNRYDGIRYGHRTQQAESLEELYKLSRAEGFGKEVKKRIMLGTFVLSADYYDAYYTKAQQVRRLIQDHTARLLSDYDGILTPTTPTPAFPIGEKPTDPIQAYLEDIFTVQANVVGFPALSFPMGKTTEGLPLGCQLMVNVFEETLLLTMSHQLSQSLHNRSKTSFVI